MTVETVCMQHTGLCFSQSSYLWKHFWSYFYVLEEHFACIGLEHIHREARFFSVHRF